MSFFFFISLFLFIIFVYYFSSIFLRYPILTSLLTHLSSRTLTFYFLLRQVSKLAGNPLANLAALGLGGITGTGGAGSLNPSGMYTCMYTEILKSFHSRLHVLIGASLNFINFVNYMKTGVLTHISARLTSLEACQDRGEPST